MGYRMSAFGCYVFWSLRGHLQLPTLHPHHESARLYLISGHRWLEWNDLCCLRGHCHLCYSLCGRTPWDHLHVRFCSDKDCLWLKGGLMSFTLSVVCIFFLAVPLCLILISYACIGHAVFKIKSLEGRKKAFGTCSSHLIVKFHFMVQLLRQILQPPPPSQETSPSSWLSMEKGLHQTLSSILWGIRMLRGTGQPHEECIHL